MLRTYRLTDAVDFILYLLEREQDDLLWQTWLHRKPSKGEGKNTKYLSYPEYKKASKLRPLRGHLHENVTADQEAQRIEFAGKFIKTKDKEPESGS